MNLIGLHDREAAAIAAPGSWVLDTIALSDNPAPLPYPQSLNWIVRCNFGYGSTGTLPVPSQYMMFAQKVARYVNGCKNCTRWVIGNEPNLPREWPDGQPIYPWQYAACYKLCRQAIRALPDHAQDEVLIAAPGPFNAEFKYEGNPNGDWIIYFTDIIEELRGELDGFSLHAYTHGYDPALVTSTARMDAPFQNRYYNFRTYQDYMRFIPQELRRLPVYITEANGNGPWQATGLMPAMLAEIDTWNKSGEQPIHSVIFYRYPKYDAFFIEGRLDVIAEYRAAAGLGYSSPASDASAVSDKTYLPAVSNQPSLPPRDIDPLALARGVTVSTPQLAPGRQYWYASKIDWLNEQQSQGRHHIYGDVYKDSAKVVGVPLAVNWPSGSATVKTEDKSHVTPPWDFWYNYPMSPSLNEFSIRVDDGTPSEIVAGIGMGANGNSHIHTCTVVEWQLATAQGDQHTPPLNPPAMALTLLWPVQGAIVTQRFGENPADYAKFGQIGHNGIDLACPVGTPVRSIADGEVMYTGIDQDYGNYCRVWIPSIHSHAFFAHLSEVDVQVGQPVKKGDTLGASGNTGNSSGPHVHFELRGGTRDSYYPASFGYSQGRYDPMIAYIVTGSPLAAGAG